MNYQKITDKYFENRTLISTIAAACLSGNFDSLKAQLDNEFSMDFSDVCFLHYQEWNEMKVYFKLS